MGTTQRIELALERMSFEKAFDFERFSLAFLASELPSLRPVGGMHDGARDAFIHSAESQPDTFVQCSVSADWAAKIRGTIKSLRENGHAVRELIYCSHLEIQAAADELRSKLRSEGVTLDVRDRRYFSMRAESTSGTKAAADELSRIIVDPLLRSRALLAEASPVLTSEDERVATTYLQLELQNRDTTKGMTKLCLESLVTYALREASPEALVKRAMVHDQVGRHVPRGEPRQLAQLTDSALARLSRKGKVKHHTKEDAFTLSHEFREELGDRISTLLAEEDALRNAAIDEIHRIIREYGIDYDTPVALVAEDVVRVLESIFCEQGRLAAVALVGDGQFSAPRKTVDAISSRLLTRDAHQFGSLRQLSHEQFLDLVPPAVERLAASSDEIVQRRLRTLADAYCLQFMLQQTPDVQKAISGIVSSITLLVDTSVAIRAMAERLLLPAEKRLTNLLRAASQLGCDLVAGDDLLNELDTHLDRIRHNSSRHAAEGYDFSERRQFSMPLLEEVFHQSKKTGGFTGPFEDFLELFKGTDEPRQDLVEYLNGELCVRYVDLSREISAISPDELGDLLDAWKKRKYRRPWVDEAAFETLVLHDVRSYLLVEKKREADLSASTYGHRWWWLAIDGAAFGFDRERHGKSPGRRVCMNPDFFARYLSLLTKSEAVASADALIPPAAIHLASLGLVPAEVRSEASRIYQESGTQPEYLRRRRLRDLINKAISTAGEANSNEYALADVIEE